MSGTATGTQVGLRSSIGQSAGRSQKRVSRDGEQVQLNADHVAVRGTKLTTRTQLDAVGLKYFRRCNITSFHKVICHLANIYGFIMWRVTRMMKEAIYLLH
jgi:hypothetical protein